MARHIYSLLLWLLLPIVWGRLLWRSIKNPKYQQRWAERLGYVSKENAGYDIWIHAVSMGEATAAIPLVQELMRTYPEIRIYITTMTPSGSDRINSAFGNTIGHSYAPYDYTFAVTRFVNQVRPKLLVLIETEIWPNTIYACWKRNIPIVMLNVRLSEKSLRKYQRITWLLKQTLGYIAQFGVQSYTHQTRLIALGVDQSVIKKTGSMKFEVKLTAGVREVAEAVRQDWGRDRLIIVAGSTHEGEEEILLRVYLQLKIRFTELLMVVAPRHPERFDSVFKLTSKMNLRATRRSEQQGSLPHGLDILIADTLGELPILYSAADIAFVGGSLLQGLGGHNILEPCAVSVPVVFGPVMPNFREISQIAIDSQAGVQVHSQNDLETQLSTLLDDPNLRATMGENGVKMVAKNAGAIELSMNILSPLIGKSK